jgi:hypothetical protein
MSAVAPAPERSPFHARLRREVLNDLEPDVLLACRVAVLQASGYRHSEIARRLPDATPAQLRTAEARVKRIAERLDAGQQ